MARLGFETHHCLIFFVKEDILNITTRLQARKFGQASILLQALSSHPHVFIMFLCESMNFHLDKQLFPSCRCRGSNSWPFDYKASTLPLNHGGPNQHCLIYSQQPQPLDHGSLLRIVSKNKDKKRKKVLVNRYISRLDVNSIRIQLVLSNFNE